MPLVLWMNYVAQVHPTTHTSRICGVSLPGIMKAKWTVIISFRRFIYCTHIASTSSLDGGAPSVDGVVVIVIVVTEYTVNFPVICLSDHCQRLIVIIGIMNWIESASDDDNNNNIIIGTVCVCVRALGVYSSLVAYSYLLNLLHIYLVELWWRLWFAKCARYLFVRLEEKYQNWEKWTPNVSTRRRNEMKKKERRPIECKQTRRSVY